MFTVLFTFYSTKKLSLDQEKFGRGVNDASGTITLSTGLGDNINLNFMTDLSDDEEGQVFCNLVVKKNILIKIPHHEVHQ